MDNEEKKILIKRLSSLEAKNVKFDWKTISLKYDGILIKNKVKMHPHEWGIADWSRHKRLVWVDDDVRAKDVTPALVHECIEKYAAQKYKLNVDTEAHKIANAIEKKYFLKKRRKKMAWQNYHKRIKKVWENEHRIHLKKKRQQKHRQRKS